MYLNDEVLTAGEQMVHGFKNAGWRILYWITGYAKQVEQLATFLTVLCQLYSKVTQRCKKRGEAKCKFKLRVKLTAVELMFKMQA